MHPASNTRHLASRVGTAASRILFCFTWLATTSLPAASDPLADWARMKDLAPRGSVCHRASQPIVVDGRLDDAAWASVPWTDDFVDIEGAAKPKPQFRTRAKMLWDDDYFYVAAELEEPHVWGTLTNHDAVIFRDPDFEVFLDPDGDSHEYYEFEINALNTGWDLFLTKPYKDGGKARNEWEIPGLKTGIHVRGTLNNPADRDEGWTVELAFPWKALAPYAHRSTPPREGDQWRVGFSRVEWQIVITNGAYRKAPGKSEDNWVWSPQGIVDMHRPERWGYVQFTAKKPGEVVFTPDGTAEVQNFLHGVYYAQRAYRAAHGRWAASFKELNWEAEVTKSAALRPTLKHTPTGFEATAERHGATGAFVRWDIREDARVWQE